MKTKASRESAIQFCKYFIDAKAIFHHDPNIQVSKGAYLWQMMFIEQRTRDRNNPENMCFTKECIDENFYEWKTKPLHSVDGSWIRASY